MKKKIIVFTSSGGNGHISATKALQTYLSDEYEIQPVYIFEEVFKGVDPAATLTFGTITGEDIYNFFLRRRHYQILNKIYRLGTWYFGIRSKSMLKLLIAFLDKQKPDLIVSVIPVVNDIILAACKDLKIPFLLIPTDFDVSSFLVRIHQPSYDKFALTLGSNDPLVLKTIANAAINPEQVVFAGLPMRKDFFETKDIGILKKQFGVPEGKPVIVIMMGGQGNTSILAFAKQLATLPISAHIIFCIGRNSSIASTIKNIHFAPYLSITVLGFTERISDLLAMADLLITKSGSVSFAEGITMKVPMILDATAPLLYWERLNHTLLTTHNWGVCLKKVTDLNQAILAILGDRVKYEYVKQNIAAFTTHRLDQEIKPIIQKLMAK